MPHDLMIRCEQRKEFIVAPQWRWVEAAVSSLAGVSSDQIRCMHCHGAVKLHRQQVGHGPQDHVEHLLHQHSQHCRGGHYFDHGEHRMSSQPVE
jgi:hypothetical protein